MAAAPRVPTRQIKGYGWQPDLPDKRDFRFARVMHRDTPLPDKVDLTPKLAPPFDQGEYGTCTFNAGALAVAFEHGGGPYSRMFGYYLERQIENTLPQDSGGQLRDVVKVLATYGIPLETSWPYTDDNFNRQPSADIMKLALPNAISQYSRLITRSDFQDCLAQGYPFIFGMSVYASFESDEVAASGVVPMPGPNEQLVGGHAVVGAGYQQYQGELYYKCRNSWGSGWGQNGNFLIPAKYVEDDDLADDFWTIRK